MTPALPADRPASCGALGLAVLLALVLSVAVRWPTLGLPIEGDAVAYGALAKSLATGDGYAIDGASHDRYPPGLPFVLSLVLRGGSSVTRAVRETGLALGVLLAPLTVLLGARLSRGRISPLLLAALASLHPSLVLFGGGLVAGSEALALDLVLAAFLLLTTPWRSARVIGLALAGLAPLVRYDATPFALGAFAVALVRAPAGRGRLAGAAGRACLAFLPLVAWIARNAVVMGSPFGTGYASHAFSLARVPGNLLVLAGLVLPAAALGVLALLAPSGLRALWVEGGEGRGVARAGLLAAFAHLVVVVLFAGPTYSGDGSMAFSSGSLRFGLAATPFVLMAACRALASRPLAWRRGVAIATVLPAAALSALLVSGTLQRSLPISPMAAGRLELLADSYRAAVGEAREADWIALDLSPRVNAGVDVFLADLGPGGHRVGVVRAPAIPRGIFPQSDVLPLAAELPADRRAVLLTDRPVPSGPIYTAGGQGIFHRVELKRLGREDLDPIFTVHQVRRTGK